MCFKILDSFTNIFKGCWCLLLRFRFDAAELKSKRRDGSNEIRSVRSDVVQDLSDGFIIYPDNMISFLDVRLEMFRSIAM